MFLRAARPIKEGEEVTSCYAPATAALEERQALLADYGFNCECVRCRLESLTPPKLRLSATSDLTAAKKSSLSIAAAAFYWASRMERAVITASSATLLAEAAGEGINLRGLFLAPSFNDLLQRVGELGASDPESLPTAELLEEGIASTLPCSPTHSWSCFTLLLAAAASSGPTTPCAARHAVSLSAAHYREVHGACYGGGEALWRRRLADSPAEKHLKFALRTPLRPLPAISACIRVRMSSGASGPRFVVAVLDVPVLQVESIAQLLVLLSDSELRMSMSSDVATQQMLMRLPIERKYIISAQTTVRWKRHRRRLLVELPLIE